jgi:hypothetical protein
VPVPGAMLSKFSTVLNVVVAYHEAMAYFAPLLRWVTRATIDEVTLLFLLLPLFLTATSAETPVEGCAKTLTESAPNEAYVTLQLHGALTCHHSEKFRAFIKLEVEKKRLMPQPMLSLCLMNANKMSSAPKCKALDEVKHAPSAVCSAYCVQSIHMTNTPEWTVKH